MTSHFRHLTFYISCSTQVMDGRVFLRFWGWNNEVHVFEPNSATWTEPQTQVKALHPSKHATTAKSETRPHSLTI